MYDKEHFERLEGRMDAVERSMASYHAKTDERIKTLFNSCEELKESMGIARNLVYVLCFVLVVAVFALVYGAIGQSGFNAVTRAATQEALR